MGFQNTTPSQITVLKNKKSPCLFSKWIIIKLLARSGSSLTGLGLRIVSRLPANLSQEPQHRSRGLKRADFRGSVWTGRTPRSQQSLTADQKRETMARPLWPQGEIQHRVGLNTRQVCKYACRCVSCAAGLRQKKIKRSKSIIFTGMLTFWCC